MKRCEKQPDFGIFNCVEVTGGVLSIFMCDTMCRWNSPPFSDPRNTSIDHFADFQITLGDFKCSITEFGQILYILNKTVLASYLCLS